MTYADIGAGLLAVSTLFSPGVCFAATDRIPDSVTSRTAEASRTDIPPVCHSLAITKRWHLQPLTKLPNSVMLSSLQVWQTVYFSQLKQATRHGFRHTGLSVLVCGHGVSSSHETLTKYPRP